MKALICTACMDIRGLPSSGRLRWVTCGCGNASARWRDPDAGTVAVCADSREQVRILGLNNRALEPFCGLGGFGPLTMEERRMLHKLATRAPAHVFDESRAACWAVVFRVGETSDVGWATDAEVRELLGA